MDFVDVLRGYDLYPKPAATLAYGTAGFRSKAFLLDHVAFRSGLLANLRSMATRQVVGLMITASHNPEEDNGVKLIDPDGGMLDLSWEERATLLVNSDTDSISLNIQSIIDNDAIDVSQQGVVLLAWDSRPSSEMLVSIAREGVYSVGGESESVGMYATPILHYLVRCRNDSSYGIPTIEGYFDKLCTAFDQLWDKYDIIGNHQIYEPEVHFDGANGVGIVTMKKVFAQLANKVDVIFYNDAVGIPGKLNYKCGADYVKQMHRFPDNVPSRTLKRFVSFDGDADRILYYYIDGKKKFHLMDGDRMAILIAVFLREIVDEANMHVSFGIVQTAYANGNSTKYATDVLRIQVSCVKTGVKYLHAEARLNDIGIYFEANGHGTVIFSEKLKLDLAYRLNSFGNSETELQALRKLNAFIQMTNETIGDAFSDFLIIESILHAKNWSIKNWDALYDDLPCQQAKVTVEDRNVITTTNAERTVVTPEDLQTEIDEIVERYPSARAFVRPSGTEDIVRVYAEASTEADVKDLVREVSRLVYDKANGTGIRP